MGSSHLRGEGEAEGSEVQTAAPPGQRLPSKKHGRTAAAGDGGGDEAGNSDAPPAAELLGVELARLRARSAVDPSVAGRSLAPAWTGRAADVEDDEAEFLDAMADCLGAGLSLDTALACWHTGDLAYDPESGDADDEAGALDATAPSVTPHHPGTGRRLLVR